MAITGLTPAPVMMGPGIAIKAFEDGNSGLAPSFAEALNTEAEAAWPTLLAVGVLGLILAGLVIRRQRAFGLGTGIEWALFVFLLGPAGLAGYWWRRRWPVREVCPACQALAPRDRETCLRNAFRRRFMFEANSRSQAEPRNEKLSQSSQPFSLRVETPVDLYRGRRPRYSSSVG